MDDGEELPVFDTPATAAPAAVRGRMRPQSCKAKGRRLQQFCASALKAAFPFLQGNDVRSLSMGAAGDDLILSPAALAVLPYNFEMKNIENLTLWATLEQVLRRYYLQDQGVATFPCVVVKRNRADAVGIIPFGHLLNRMLGRVEVDPMMPTANLPQCWAQQQPLCPWTAGCVVECHEKRTLNFWAYWDAFRTRTKKQNPVLLFNRGDPNYTVFVALPFAFLVQLFEQSYAADPLLPGVAK